MVLINKCLSKQNKLLILFDSLYHSQRRTVQWLRSQVDQIKAKTWITITIHPNGRFNATIKPPKIRALVVWLGFIDCRRSYRQAGRVPILHHGSPRHDCPPLRASVQQGVRRVAIESRLCRGRLAAQKTHLPRQRSCF